MMVEAGAKILPEDVMAEAILFAHRALEPLIDLQLELQEAVGKAKRLPFLEPGTESVLDFAAKAKAGAEFVVVDVETTGTNAEMADLVEIAAVRVKGGKITDRWSTFVNPGPADLRQPDARHHRQGRQGRAEPRRGRQEGPRLRRRRHASSATRSASTSPSSRPRSATGRGSRRAATSTR